jgi:hypothetical protein
LCFVVALACAVQACDGSTSASDPEIAATHGPHTGGSGGASEGGKTGAGGSGGIAQGGSAQEGSGGTTTLADGGIVPGSGGTDGTHGDGGTKSGGSVDLVGTWIADVKGPGVETVPTVGTIFADLRVVVRFVITEASGTLSTKFDICKLNAVTTPDPKALTVTFTPAVLATLNTTVSESTPTVHVGDAVPMPAFTVLSGIDAAGTSIDADSDSHPGVTIPGVVAGTWPASVYAGLTIPVTLSATLSAPDALSGTLTFSANGKIFATDTPWLTSGNMSVSPQPADVPFTAKLLPGDVPCTDVLNAFP